MANRNTASTVPQDDKEKLELEKLHLELQALRHPVKASFKSFTWKDLVTIVVAGSALLLGFLTGLFNVRQQRLQVANERLGIERIQLEQGNKELEETRSLLTLEEKQLVAELKKTKSQLVSYEKEREAIQTLASGFGLALTTKLTLRDGADSFGFEIQPGGYGTREYLGGDVDPKEDEHIPEILDTLQHVQRLSSLRIEDIALSEDDIRRIANLSIVRLTLSNNGLSDEMVEPIAQLSQLAHLSFEGNKAIRHPQALGQLRNLTFLHLERTSYDDEGLARIRHLGSKLQYLFMQATEVSDDGLAHLKEFTALEWLDLTTCRNVTGPGLVELVTLPSLKYLKIDYCGIEDDGHLEFLESLRRRNPDLVIDAHFGQRIPPAPKK